MDLGLKLWSTNDLYVQPVLECFAKGIYDYIELYVVPESLGSLKLWKDIDIPFVLHAPHSISGFNLAKKNCKIRNYELAEQVDSYRKALNPEFIIFHPGIEGALEETIRQMCEIRRKFPEMHKLMLVENKPRFSLKGEICRGTTVDEIKEIINKTGFGFCLDIGHAICAANSSESNWREVYANFISMQPSMFHLSDGNINSEKDAHLNYGKGNFPMTEILDLLPANAMISIETEKCSNTDLNDFKKDTEQLKRYLTKLV